MKYTLLISLLIVFFAHSSFSQIKLYEWEDDMYSEYSFESFVELEVLKEEINPMKIDYKLLSAALFYRTNKARAENDLSPFSYSSKLYQSAQGHSEDMVNHNFYSHASTVKGKESLADRLRLVKLYPFVYSENLSFVSVSGSTYSDLSEKIVDGWLNSPKHKSNILHDELKYLGCGIYTGSAKNSKQLKFYSTQNFSSNN